jgi:protein-tyrosine kinase
MTRIDEALRRARGDLDAPDEVEPTDDESPWAIDARDTTDVVAPRVALPQAPPVRETPPDDLPDAPPHVHTQAAEPDEGPFARAVTGNEKLVGGALPAVMVEEYRKLATSLHQAQEEQRLQVLLVASAIPGEGKTLTAANLALTLSLSFARRTLLVDADLRRPSLHSLFRLPTTSGLSEGLSSGDTVRVSAVQLSPTLALLPAGRPVANPVPLLTSARMQQLIADARQHFDWVIVDTPPVGLLADGNLLTAMADASILVINAGHTQHALVEKALVALGRAKVFGVVMNRVEEGATISGSSYSGYYKDYLPAQR